MEEKKNLITRQQITWIVTILAALCTIAFVCVTISRHDPTSSQQTIHAGTQDSSPPTETLSEEERNQMIRDAIDQAVSDWAKGAISFEEVSETLIEFQNNSNAELALYANERLAFITLEEESRAALELAQKFCNVKNYVLVFKTLNGIDPAYTNYSSVLELYNFSKEQVLLRVANPATQEDYEAYIQLLEECNELYPSPEFSERSNELKDELVIFIDISETIQASAELFDNGQVEESFVLLALGLEKYPENERLSSTLVNFRDHYIIAITTQAIELCQKEQYKDALLIVDTAIQEYDCTEFHMLREAIKEEKSFLYRLKNDIVDAFTAFTHGWTEEEFDVVQAANNAGAYIVKSGEKLALGDYSEENITLLSFSGNVAASLAGVDLLFDLRDLSYDITHWGEDEYFAVWLATDIVALIPVIGVVKYLSHFKTAANGVETATELVDSVTDVGKNAENAAELAEAVSEVTKVGDEIVEAVDNAKDVVKAGDAAKDVVSDVLKEYTLIDTINQKLLGKVHEVTGIEFKLSSVELSDGKRIKGVFPVFESYADIRLPENLYKASFSDQQKECLKQLQEQLKYPWSKLRKNFTEEQLDDIAQGILPEGFTWHHNEEEGLMQLVDTLIHDQTGHTGGMSLWGRGY